MSDIDNIVFKITRRGYFGQKLAHKAEATMTKSISDKSKWRFVARNVIVLLMAGCRNDGKSDPCD